MGFFKRDYGLFSYVLMFMIISYKYTYRNLGGGSHLNQLNDGSNIRLWNTTLDCIDFILILFVEL